MPSQPARRAAVYVRMSTDEQVNSPDRQWTQIDAYCRRKGYTVVRRYEDLGLRGYDDTRPEFNALIKDAQARHFDVVVVDEQSRLARTDPVTFIAKTVAPLRDAGVVIDTVAKGLVDWDDLGGFIVGAVTQHAASGEVINLSRRITTELARKALKGDVVAGKAPYGYELVWVDADNQVVHVGRRTWQKRPAGWTPQFRVKEEEAKVVRWVFDAYVVQDISLNSITKELRNRGILSPRGGTYWNRSHLRNMLTHRVYVGDWVFNRVSVGTYHRLSWEPHVGGRTGVAEAKRLTRTPGNKCNPVMKNDPKDWVVIEGRHPAIIDRELFQRAGAALKGNRNRSTPSGSRVDYPLASILACGKCGSWMTGDRDATGKFYQCGGYQQHGVDHCNPHRVLETDAVGLVLGQLHRHFLNPTRVKAVLAAVGGRKHVSDTDKCLAELMRMRESLRQRIDRAEENLLVLETQRVARAQARIRKLEAQESDTARAIEELGGARPVEDTERLVGRVGNLLSNLHMLLALAPTELNLLRRAVRGCVRRVELDFSTQQKKVRRRHTLVGGRTYFLNEDVVRFQLRTQTGNAA